MNRVSADTRLFIHAADPDSTQQVRAREFIGGTEKFADSLIHENRDVLRRLEQWMCAARHPQD